MTDYDGHGALVGKRIESIDFAHGGTAIRFNTTEGPLVYLAEGECCSSSWIEHVEGVDRLIGATVAKVEDIALDHSDEPEQPSDSYHDEIAYYGLAIDTDKGRAIIDYRNSSNGYYGGSLELAGSHSYQDAAPDSTEWEPLTADV